MRVLNRGHNAPWTVEWPRHNMKQLAYAHTGEAIDKVAQRWSIRFMGVKRKGQQANGVMFRARDLLVRKRTQCIKALRGHLAEYGYLVPQAITHSDAVIAYIEDRDSSVPESARAILTVLVATFRVREAQV